MSTVIRSLMVKIGTDLSDFDKSMKKISRDLGKAGKNISNAGAGLTKGLTVPLIAVGAGLTAVVGKSIETADELQKLSDVTGLSAERLQELKFAGSALGVELETITGAQAKLTKSMSAARGGTGKQADAFKQLGISVVDSNGKLRDSKKVMEEAFTKLNSVGNETERDALAMQLFGKSAMELNPLIKAGGDGLAKLTEEARKNGAVISNENISSLDNFGDSLDKMKASLGAAAGKMAAKLMPTLEKLLPVLQDKIIPAIGKFLEKVGEVITKFAEMSPEKQGLILTLIGVAAAIGPVLSVVGPLITIIGGVVGAFGAAAAVITGGGGIIAALAALLGPVGIAIAVIAGIAAIAFVVIKNWGSIKTFFKGVGDSIVKVFNGVLTFVKDNWKQILIFICNPFAGILAFLYKLNPQFKAWIDGLIEMFLSIPKKIGEIGTKVKNAVSSIFGKKPKVTVGVGGMRGMNSYAKGTNFHPGGMAMVGEKGPELLNLPRGSQVTPNNKLGGTVINITGNNISNDYDVDRIGKLLVQKLKLAGVRV